MYTVCTDSGESEEAVVDRDLNLTDDVETVTEEEIIVSVNRTSERILHLEDGTIRDPELHRLKRDVELITRDSFRVRVSFPATASEYAPGTPWYATRRVDP